MSTDTHRAASEGQAVTCAVVTLSDTRTEATDTSGRILRAKLEEAGHTVADYAVLPDEAERLRAHLQALAPRVDVVITSGGTGIAGHDTTVEVAEALIEKPMPGFGELFRMLSWEEIGPAAMLSRATAGVYGLDAGRPTLLFCLPGSSKAVTLAMERLIGPELRHLVWEVLRQR